MIFPKIILLNFSCKQCILILVSPLETWLVFLKKKQCSCKSCDLTWFLWKTIFVIIHIYV
ncbi:hypothetical protein HanIR_Chr02g0070521 [Helianthus annuus]|nr:hypothetical protein HanIR_Chr02g0070521 [Helianthus annuus]